MFYLLTFCSILFLLSFFYVKRITATSSESVKATVKISVCGNGIAEGGEDCDNSDLRGNTCNSIGLGTGVLSCDIACSYDTSDCISPTPTLTPSPSPTPTAPPFSLIETITETPTLTPTPTSITPTPIHNLKLLLPQFMTSSFDTNGDGKIEKNELPHILETWVNSWKNWQSTKTSLQECNVNNDDRCDIKDLSVLLYYVER